MNFKEALSFEAENVFLNENEFADLLSVNGAAMPALWGQQSDPAPDVLEASVDAWGLNSERAVLLVPASRLPLPVPGQTLLVEGAAWQVKKAEAKSGILRLELERNVS